MTTTLMSTSPIRITDVAPRDGLQNEPAPIPTADKAALVNALARTGVDEVEVTSFVSAKWVPQLGDAADLCEMVAASKPTGAVYSALVPNERGLGALLAANASAEATAGSRVIDKASVFTAASETFSTKNTNASIAETIARFRPVITRAHDAGLATRGYVSCIVACPFEGPIAAGAVADVASQLLRLGVTEIDLGDTIGAATPESIAQVIMAVRPMCDAAGADLVLHLHDTFGRASECIGVALELGVRSFDASAAGIGGCPYASTPDRRAPGNIATLALLDAIEAAGYAHDVDRAALQDAGQLALDAIARAGAMP